MVLAGVFSSSYVIFLLWAVPLSHPQILFDEYVYTKASYHTPGEIGTGSYLYTYLLNALSFLPQYDFYYVAKLLNITFVVLLGFGVYLIARSFVSFKQALFIALLVPLFPIGIWVNVLMPDMMHISMMILTLGLVHWGLSREKNWLYPTAVVSGVVFGLANLVKIHSMFLIPGLLAVFAFMAWKRFGPRYAVYSSLIWLLSGLTVKTLLGYVLGGPDGARLLGGYQEALFARLFGGGASRSLGANLNFLGFSGTITDETTSPGLIPLLVIDRLSTHLPVFLLMFGWVLMLMLVLSTNSRVELGRTEFTAYHALLASSPLTINALLLSIAFNVYVTLIGDDHTNRVLFRYLEFVLIYSSILAIVAVMTVQARKHLSPTLRAVTILLPVIIFALTLFGPQGRISISYADSAFIPVVGNLAFWLSIFVFLTVGALFIQPATRGVWVKSYPFVAISIFVTAGIASQLSYTNLFSDNDIEGVAVAERISNSPEMTANSTFLIADKTTPSALVGASLAFDELNYGRTFGTNPVVKADIPDTAKYVILMDRVLVDLDLEGFTRFGSGEGYMILERKTDEKSLANSLSFPEIQGTGDFEYATHNALVSRDGEITFSLDRSLREGRALEACMSLPEGIGDRFVVLSIEGQDVRLDITGQGIDGVGCVTLGADSTVDTKTVAITAPVLTNELTTGDFLSEVSVAVQRLRVVG